MKSNKMFKKIKNFICRKDVAIVACVNLSGVIGKDSKIEAGLNFNNVEPLLKRAFAIKKVKAVAINVNSPGVS